SFAETNKGTLFAGTWNDGLYQYDRDLKLIPLNIRGFNEVTSPWMWSMFASRKDSNIIWMSSQPGIFKVNQT
ncbi:MAG: hypothetical protein J7527_19075, partial [Chitinophagaceae bacterium]|nr:hypothetical protein [Chitinophagaceae bacterium]